MKILKKKIIEKDSRNNENISKTRIESKKQKTKNLKNFDKDDEFLFLILRETINKFLNQFFYKYSFINIENLEFNPILSISLKINKSNLKTEYLNIIYFNLPNF